MFAGYVCLGYMWAKMALVAQEQLAAGSTEKGFYTAKLQTANFYFQRILPRAEMHGKMTEASLASLMDMEESNFAF